MRINFFFIKKKVKFTLKGVQVDRERAKESLTYENKLFLI